MTIIHDINISNLYFLCMSMCIYCVCVYKYIYIYMTAYNSLYIVPGLTKDPRSIWKDIMYKLDSRSSSCRVCTNTFRLTATVKVLALKRCKNCLFSPIWHLWVYRDLDYTGHAVWSHFMYCSGVVFLHIIQVQGHHWPVTFHQLCLNKNTVGTFKHF